jgi:tetratricopeptide (TPR) repeat protein
LSASVVSSIPPLLKRCRSYAEGCYDATMKTLLLTLLFPTLAQGAGVSLGTDEAHGLWKSGVESVINGQKKTAAALWKRCLTANPHNRDCQAGLILLGHKVGSPVPKAELSLEQGGIPQGARPRIRSSSDSRAAQKNWTLGTRAFQSGNWRAARDYWTRCLELDPESADCSEGLSRVDRKEGRPKRGGNAAAKHYAAGMRAFMQKQYGAARKAWKKCLQVNPRHTECKEGLARLQ